ncbi:MAG: major facilitator superfamily domain-containing protein 6 [Anaerolineales bacterium]
MMKKIWPFSFYFLTFAAMASLLPFFVIFYQGLGFSGTEIGLLTGVPPLITLFGAPFGTGLADRTHRHKLIMSIGLISAVVMAILLPSLKGFVIIFGIIALYNLFMAPVGSLADSATMGMLGGERAMYGRIRLGGTLGWAILAPVAGWLVQQYGLRIAFWLFASITLINFFVSQKFDFGKQDAHESENGGIRDLLSNRSWIFFLLASLVGGVGTLSVSSYLYPYMAEIGANESQMGIAALIATMTELPIFFFGDRLVKRFGSYTLFMAALVLLGLRSLMFAWASTTWMVYVVQALGGMMFPAMWLAGVSYADENAPAGLKSTGQGLFSAMCFGFGSAVGGFVGGILLERVGGHSMFFVLGLVILASLLLIEVAKRIFPAKEMS